MKVNYLLHTPIVFARPVVCRIAPIEFVDGLLDAHGLILVCNQSLETTRLKKLAAVVPDKRRAVARHR